MGRSKLIIYNEPSSRFLEHILDNEIGYVLQNNVKNLMNKSISASELRSWENPLPQMAWWKGIYDRLMDVVKWMMLK